MKFDTILKTDNLADALSPEKLSVIGAHCLEGLKQDLQSRKDWEDRMAEAIKLAIQLEEKKNTPWENASNVKFPLLSIAAIQFSSRVFPQLFSTPKPVKMKVVGKDPKAEKHDRADRVSSHMSYQCLEEDEDWISEHDILTLVLPIMGCGFTKTFHDDVCTSVHVHAKDLIVNYFAKSLETCNRYTHKIPLYKNEVIERQRSGRFIKKDIYPIQSLGKDPLEQVKDDRQGIYNSVIDDDSPIDFYEQYCYLDLDEDDYKEPYTVTFDLEGRVHRIVKRFKRIDYNPQGEIQKIFPKHYFTKYSFIPSPDGGFYDLGFGSLLSPINKSVNTTINQLIDAGTLANHQGGFLGRGARLKGGKIKYKMGEFLPINSTGDDIRKNVFLMPFKEPSQVLFQLLTYLVEYGERLSAVSDMMVGKTPGQNTPATTAMASLEEGMKVFTAIYQRVYRGLKKEFQKRYLINQEYLDPQEYYEIEDDTKAVFQQDYMGDPKDIRPSADPNMSSEVQRLMRIEALTQRAATVSGYNIAALERRYLEVLNVEGVDEIFPVDKQGRPVIQPPGDPKIEIESAKFEAEQSFNAQKLEIEGYRAEAEVAVKETQAILNLAKAEELDNKVEIEAYKTLLEELRIKKDEIRERSVRGVDNRPNDKGDSKVSE